MGLIPGFGRLGEENSLVKEIATYSRSMAWEIPWTEEPVGQHSPWGDKELDQLSHPYMTTGKTISLTRQTFVGKVICQVFKYAVKVCHSFSCKEYASLISWLQSASAVILEPKK